MYLSNTNDNTGHNIHTIYYKRWLHC